MRAASADAVRRVNEVQVQLVTACHTRQQTRLPVESRSEELCA